MQISLLVLVWVGIAAIIALTVAIVAAMVRLTAVLKNVDRTMQNITTVSALVEKVVEQGGKSIFSAVAKSDAIRQGIKTFIQGKAKKE